MANEASPQGRFRIYSASAGSGKTYTLTREYLRLALGTDDAHYFRHILAITFTNDAANEMKARILANLRGFAFLDTLEERERKRINPLLESLADELGEKPQTLRDRAQRTFSKILYHYTDFAVSTIDKFINRVTNAFTRELDLPYNYEIDLDQQTMLQNAVDRVLAKVGRDDTNTLSSIVIRWVMQQAEEGKNFARLGEELVKFAGDLLREGSYQYINQLRSLNIEDFQLAQAACERVLHDTLVPVRRWAQEAADLLEQAGIQHDDLAQKKRGLPTYLEQHIEYEPEKVFDNDYGFVKTMLRSNTFHGGKKPKPALLAIQPELAALLQRIEDYKTTHRPRFLLCQNLLPHLYKLALIQEIEQELVEVKRENNTIHISDTNKRIAEIISSEPVPYIYERVGERYHHLLIDEFQDTSLLQGYNLLPLVENSLAEGNFNLLVGDVKQAIYRWRGGEMEQLLYLYERTPEKLLTPADQEEKPFLIDRYQMLARETDSVQLQFNYRSTREVIEFNNDFFRTLIDSDWGELYPKLAQVFATLEQQIPPSAPLGGHVELQFIESGEDYDQQMRYEVLARLNALHEEGWQWGDMAVLVRKNKNASQLAMYLQENGVRVVSSDSLRLVFDEKVRFLVAMMKVIHRPEDKLTKSEALYLFYQVVRHQTITPELGTALQIILSQSIVAFYEHLRVQGYAVSYSKVPAMNLYELAERLISIFGLYEDGQKLDYLFRFLDVILQFSQQKQATLGDFLEYWDDKKESLSVNTAASRDAVVVTSIHKSKGLEYPVVIVPFCDWSLTPPNGATLWVNLPPDTLAFEDSQGNTRSLPVGLVSIRKGLEQTDLQDLYQTEMEKAFIENLNLLYVAFTRPIYRLYVISKHTTAKSKKGSKSKEGEGDATSQAAKSMQDLLKQFCVQKDIWEEQPFERPLKTGEQPPQAPPPTEEDDSIFYIEQIVSTETHKRLKIRKNKS